MAALEAVEFATLAWVDWLNSWRLGAPLGHVPPIEFERAYYARSRNSRYGGGPQLTESLETSGPLRPVLGAVALLVTTIACHV